MDLSCLVNLTSKYQLIKLIGKGSTGSVYLVNLVENPEIQRIAKIIKRIGNNIQKIKYDIGIPKKLNHTNIIKVVDYIQDDEYDTIIYPYLPKTIVLSKINCKKIINNKKMVKMIKNIMIKITLTIEYIHNMGYIHKDIKRENILIVNGEPIIIDFDLSFSLDNPEFPLIFPRSGTPHYMAPEIFIGKYKPDKINYKLCDIYSLGITFYAMFNNGSKPYGDDKENLIKNIISGKINESNSGVKILDDLIMNMIDINPYNRPSYKNIINTINTISTLV